MKLTSVTFRLTKRTTSKTVAFCDLTFDNLLTVKSFKLINGNRGLWLTLPSEFEGDKWVETSMFKGEVGQEFYKAVEQRVIQTFVNEHGEVLDELITGVSTGPGERF